MVHGFQDSHVFMNLSHVSQEPATIFNKAQPCFHPYAYSRVRQLLLKKKRPVIYSDILLVSFPKDQFLLKKYTKQMTVHAERCHFTNVFK